MNTRWFYGWNVLALTVVFQAIGYGMVMYGFALYVVPWKQEFSAPIRDIMICVAAMQLSIGVQSALVGRALERFSTRYLVALGGFLLGVALALMSLATALWHIILLYATLIPAALSLTGPLVAQSLIIRWFKTRRGMALGISATGTSIGGLIFPILSSTLISSSGWRYSLVVLACIATPVVCVLAGWVLRKEPDTDTDEEAPDAAATTDNRRWTNKEIIRSPLFWIPVITFIPIIASYSAVQFNLGTFMQTLDYDAQQAAILISILAVAMLMGKLAFGSLADWVDHRLLYAGAVASLCLSLLLFQGQPSLLQIRVGTFFLAIAGGAYIPLSGMIIGILFGAASFGRVMGLFTLCITSGAFGPILAGWIYDSSGSFDSVFTTFLFVLIPPALLMVFLKVPKLAAINNDVA